MAKDEPRTRRLVVATFSIIRLQVAAKYWISVAGEYLKLSVKCLSVFVFSVFFLFFLFFFVCFVCFVTCVKCPLTYLTQL